MSEEKDENRLKVTDYLQKEGISFNVLYNNINPMIHVVKSTQNAIAKEATVRAVALKYDQQIIMAVYPLSFMLDYQKLCEVTGKTLEPLSYEEVTKLNVFSSVGQLPPFPQVLKIPVVIDKSLLEFSHVYIEPGEQDRLLKISQEDFRKILGHPKIDSIGIPLSQLRTEPLIVENEDNPLLATKEFLVRRMHQRIKEMHELPIISDTARELLKLRCNPNASIRMLANIVLRDPILSAQVIHWARSPYYGFSGHIDSVEDAIIHVLGFDLVMNLSIGLAISGDIKMPVQGALGLKAFWQSAVYSAAMIQELAKKIPDAVRETKGTLYLSGLLHNFGMLILGHMFVDQHRLFNHQIQLNQQIPVRQLQYQFFGVGYEQVGHWLFRTWNLPDEILVAARWHNNASYTGPHESCVHLLQISACLLKRIGIGFADSKVLPAISMKRLGLTEDEVIGAFEKIILDKDALNDMSQQLIRK